eukprot:CCRYP_011528-RB/>CCRYP_011528-RB protein AED:0.47 eAED:0.47 QI:0/-1/0/1/-1/0/1/0/32
MLSCTNRCMVWYVPHCCFTRNSRRNWRTTAWS